MPFSLERARNTLLLLLLAIPFAVRAQTGIGGSVFFHRPGFLPGIRMQILTAQEGYYTPADKPGAPEVWHVKRVLNGDETDRGIRFPAPSAKEPSSGDAPPPAPAHAGPIAVRIVLGRF